MATRLDLTARFWLAAAASSMLYLRPANLDFCTAHADPPATNKFTAKAVCHDFRQRFSKGGWVDFGFLPTAPATAGITGQYAVGLVSPALGPDGKILPIFETDATKDWQIQTTPTVHNVYGIDFPADGLTGFAAAGTMALNTGAIIKTVDGGTTWTLAHTAVKMLADIDMVDTNTGWAVGRDGHVLKTSDGTNWSALLSPGPVNIWTVSAIDADVAFMAGNSAIGGIVAKTIDGGSNWTVMTSAETGTTNPLLGSRFLDSQTGWIAGNNGTILKTTDGGASWTASYPVGAGIHLRGVHVHDANRVWVAGNSGTILHSTDGGNTWTAQVSGTIEQLNSIHFADDGLGGFAVGNNGTMRATCDGGVTWYGGQKIVGVANYNDVKFLADAWLTSPPNSGFAMGFVAGNGGVVYERIRGGVDISSEWTHANGSTQARQMHDAAQGDTAGGHNWVYNAFVSSPLTMKGWFNDVPGFNLSAVIDLEFNKVGSGAGAYFQFDTAAFDPVEGMLMDNIPGPPNDLFTVEGHYSFVYDADDGQWITIRANADVWMFINDVLVMDMGGIHGVTSQHVDFDRLGLSDGTSYSLDVFIAERIIGADYELRVATNVYLESKGIPTISDAKD